MRYNQTNGLIVSQNVFIQILFYILTFLLLFYNLQRLLVLQSDDVHAGNIG